VGACWNESGPGWRVARRRRWRPAAGDGEEGDGDATAPPLPLQVSANPLLTPCRSCAGLGRLGPRWIPTPTGRGSKSFVRT
jgi:hypothetical protein